MKNLINGLSKLIEILELDPSCQWISTFRYSLTLASSLVGRNYEKDELSNLSSSITYVYSGMGSFNDYWPGTYNSRTGRYNQIPGTEDFEEVKTEVFELAIRLRTDIL